MNIKQNLHQVEKMITDKERLLKAIAYINGLRLNYSLKRDNAKIKKYSKFNETYNQMRVKNATTLLINTDLLKLNPVCPDCKGTGKIKCMKCNEV